ncbi:MAG: beta-ketoacyl-ACP synthase, partial [Xanthobacteraceae bacterium]|nr:beta-ketoacyl-ACP synthase [Xanthobacteraceae bacterium]
KTTVAGTIDFIPADPLCAPALSEEFAMVASQEAIAEAKIGRMGDFPGPLFVAVPPVEVEWPQRIEIAATSNSDEIGYDEMIRLARTGRFARYYERFLYRGTTERLADRLGTKGSPIALSTACASGASAIQLGVEGIRRGESDAALAVGTDGSVNTEALIRFALLSALSTQNDPPQGAAKPFSKNRDGFVMAEGAAVLVLENLDSARARGAKILGIIEGCGEMADSFHRTRSSPDGKPIIGCIKNALADAGVTPDDVDYINAHGTGTPENDRMECLSVSAVFGERIGSVPISSNKSMIGHTLSAAGAVEAAFSLMTIAHQRIPPTINYNVPDPAILLDVVPNVARDAKVRRAISNSFGFGGQNVCLVVSGEPN